MSQSTESDSANKVTITLNGEDANITAGGNGRAGTVTIKSDATKELVRLGYTGGARAVPVQGRYELVVPVEGGAVYVNNADEKETIRLSGTDSSLLIRDQTGRVAVEFSGANVAGKPSGLSLGVAKADGGMRPGLLLLRDFIGEDGIELDGSSGIVLRDESGKLVFNLATRTGIPGAPSGLWLGKAKADGGGRAGLLIIRDASGVDAITLDGAKGDIMLANADVAEEFEVDPSENVEPGTVMVLYGVGTIAPSREAYDRKVAGVISGAGGFKPGLLLDKKSSPYKRRPLAVTGKVFCKVDARYYPIEVGDLLTTSDTAGHAMKAVDPVRAFGAVIGKALAPLEDGQDILPILAALQ